MNKNKQFAIFVIILCLIGIAAIKSGFTSKKSDKNNEKIRIGRIDSPKVLEKGKIEVNQADIKDMVSLGISLKIAEKIAEFREKTGCIENIEEIDCLSGVGAKTMEKIRERLYVDSSLNISKKKLNINKISQEEMSWIGFNKKEVKEILKWKSTNGDINSNLDLIKIVGENRYRDFKEKVVYQNY